MILERTTYLRTTRPSLASVKTSLLMTIALTSISACSTDGADNSEEPQTLVFNQATTTDTLSDRLGDTVESADELSTDQENSEEIVSAGGSNTQETSTDTVQLDDATAVSTVTSLDDQPIENNSSEGDNNHDESNLSFTNLTSQEGISLLTNASPILPSEGEIPAMRTSSELTPDSPAANLLSSLETASSIILANLNSKLSGGEELSPEEQNCLYDYDEAEGKPLLGLQCTSSIGLDLQGILNVQEAAFLNTESCITALASMELGGCDLFAATIEIRPHSDFNIEPPFGDNGRLAGLFSTIIERPETDITRPESFTSLDLESFLSTRPNSSSDLTNLSELSELSDRLADLAQNSTDSDQNDSANNDNATQIPVPSNLNLAEILDSIESNRPSVNLESLEITNLLTNEALSNFIDKPSESDQDEPTDDDNATQSPSLSELSLDEILESIETNRPGVTIESSDPSNIATSEEVDTEEFNPEEFFTQFGVGSLLSQTHTGASIQFGTNSTELTVNYQDDTSSSELSTCSIDISTSELTSGTADACDVEFARLSERLNLILTTITDESGSL